MAMLNPDDLTVDTFQTTPAFSSLANGPAALAQPGITNGIECNKTLDYSCTACYCHTPAYDCV